MNFSNPAPSGFGMQTPSVWAKPATALSIALFLVGIALVGFRANSSAKSQRALAQARAAACVANFETELNRMLTAAEVLGSISRQSGGPVPDFQTKAGEIFATYPGLTTLELQPAGIVSDIVPRAAGQRAKGFNVFRDVAYGENARAAVEAGSVFLALPTILYNGETGAIVRVPIFQNPGTAQKRFWGFVTASMSLRPALSRAGVLSLQQQGYDYALLAVSRGKSSIVSAQGSKNFANGLQQSVRVRNIELRLALQRRGGWVNKAEVLLETAVVLLISGLAWGWASRKADHRKTSLALEQTTRELAEVKIGRDRLKSAMAEAEARAQQDITHLQESLQETQATAADSLARLARSEQRVLELDETLTAAKRAAQSAALEFGAELKKVQATAIRLQASLDSEKLAAEQKEKTQAAGLEQVRLENRELRLALDNAANMESRVAQLEAELEAAKAAAVQKEQAWAAGLEQSWAENRELKLSAENAGKMQSRVAQLETRLEAAKTAAERKDEAHAAALEKVRAENFELKLALAEAQKLQKNAVATEPAPERVQVPGEEVQKASDASAVVLETVPSDSAIEALASNPPPDPVASSANEFSAKPVRRKKAREKGQQQIDLFEAALPAAAEAEKPRDKKAEIIEGGEREEDESEAESSAASVNEVVGIELRQDDGFEDDFEERSQAESVSEEDSTAQEEEAGSGDPGELRVAVHQIFPLLIDQDPGAKDCLKDNRQVFRSALSTASFEEFEKLVKKGDYRDALEYLKKGARRYGIHI